MYFPSKWGKTSHPKEEFYNSPKVSSHTARNRIHMNTTCGTNCSSNQLVHKDNVKEKRVMHQHLDKLFLREEAVHMG